MNRFLSQLAALSVCAFAIAAGNGCAVQPETGDEESEVVEFEQPFTSDVATLLDFEFDGELLTNSNTNLKGQVRAQMLYTVGHINAEPGVARLDRLALTNLTVAAAGSLYRVRYHARLPVAWGSKTNLPSSYTLTLPRRVDAAGQNAFTTKYAATCADDAHDANVSNFWYHYRPRLSGCSLAPADVVTANATAKVSSENVIAKYPEFHKVWEDGALNVVSIFGKYEDGATTAADAGISAYNEFTTAVKAAFPAAQITTASTSDVTFKVDLGGGRRLQIVALLVDNVRTAPASFDQRYSELSPGADVIVYNGHAGLGANVRALSQKGKFFPGKYQIFFMNGCDTFAYVDGALAQVRATLNPDDVAGTKYMDIVSNAMPAYFMNMSEASLSLVRALANPAAPKSYGTIFREIDASQVVVVTGEEDNRFSPSYRPKSSWGGFHQTGAVKKSEEVAFVTETLPPGTYSFTMTPDASAAGGDADLYVRAGAAPTATAAYKCKSYVYNSNERCVFTVTAPTVFRMIAKGDKLGVTSSFRIDAFAL